MKKDFNVDETYSMVLKVLRKNMNGNKSVDILDEVVERLNKKYTKHENEVKKRVSRDFMKFFGFWFTNVKDAEKVSKNSQSILLNINTVNPWRFFKDVYVKFNNGFMTTLPDDSSDEGKLVRYINICLKGVIQTKKRSIGMDANSKKYPVE